jgi:hypothetical protein
MRRSTVQIQAISENDTFQKQFRKEIDEGVQSSISQDHGMQDANDPAAH